MIKSMIKEKGITFKLEKNIYEWVCFSQGQSFFTLTEKLLQCCCLENCL